MGQMIDTIVEHSFAPQTIKARARRVMEWGERVRNIRARVDAWTAAQVAQQNQADARDLGFTWAV